MGRLTEAIARYLGARDVPFDRDPRTGFLTVDLPGPPGTVHLIAPLEDNEQLVYWAVLPVAAAEEWRPAIAELFTRINYGLLVGDFEMDWNDGELRVRTSIDVEDVAVTDPLVDGLIGTNVAAVEYFAAVVTAVAAGIASPSDALAALD